MKTDDSKPPEWFTRLTPGRQRKVVRSLMRRQAKANQREAFRSLSTQVTPGSTGYCCPKCHRWYTTTEERAACRASHHQVAT